MSTLACKHYAPTRTIFESVSCVNAWIYIAGHVSQAPTMQTSDFSKLRAYLLKRPDLAARCLRVSPDSNRICCPRDRNDSCLEDSGRGMKWSQSRCAGPRGHLAKEKGEKRTPGCHLGVGIGGCELVQPKTLFPDGNYQVEGLAMSILTARVHLGSTHVTKLSERRPCHGHIWGRIGFMKMFPMYVNHITDGRHSSEYLTA